MFVVRHELWFGFDDSTYEIELASCQASAELLVRAKEEEVAAFNAEGGSYHDKYVRSRILSLQQISLWPAEMFATMPVLTYARLLKALGEL